MAYGLIAIVEQVNRLINKWNMSDMIFLLYVDLCAHNEQGNYVESGQNDDLS
jgi:hypothetical protein